MSKRLLQEHMMMVAVLTTVTSILVPPVSLAQTVPPPSDPSDTSAAFQPEPEYNFVISVLDLSAPRLIELERQTPEVQVKVKGLGFGGAQGDYVVPGAKSAVRFPADRQIEFVIRVESRSTDPQQQIEFFRWQVKKGNRHLMLAKVSTFRGSKGSVEESAIKFATEKYGQASFRFWPTKPLPPGEYAVSSPYTEDSFCFGVDPVATQ